MKATPSFAARALGFTLIELMLTLALAAVVMAIAIPNMTVFSKNGRLTANANDLVHSFQIARTEAIKAQKNIVVCASNNSGTLAANCSDGNFTGWIVFSDDNSNWQHDAGETIIQSHEAMPSSLSVASNGSGIRSYGPNGFANPPGASGKVNTTKIIICDSRGNVDQGGGFSKGARLVGIDATGHARATNKYADIAAVATCP